MQNERMHMDVLDEVKDIILNILDDHTLCSKLLFDPDYDAMFKAGSFI